MTIKMPSYGNKEHLHEQRFTGLESQLLAFLCVQPWSESE